jgi:23S rRNA pseudoU1915 N3-methylase RlmH
MRGSMRLVNLPPVWGDSREEIVYTETQSLISYIYTSPVKRSHIVILDASDISWTTDERNEHLAPWGEYLCIIGGPFGMDVSMLRLAIQKRYTWLLSTISLGHHTMPHGLVKLVMCEQLYRISMMQSGKTYNY